MEPAWINWKISKFHAPTVIPSPTLSLPHRGGGNDLSPPLAGGDEGEGTNHFVLPRKREANGSLSLMNWQRTQGCPHIDGEAELHPVSKGIAGIGFYAGSFLVRSFFSRFRFLRS